MSNDPYSYPDIDVLRNKANIRDADKLAEFEYRSTAIRALEQQEEPIKGKFDLKHLQAIHKHMFQDVYEWAGEIRSVSISKGNSQFAPPGQIEGYGNSTVFKDLAKDKFLVNMEKDKFTERLAHHFSEINALHPFREGNGRSSRQFIEQVAKNAGYDMDFSKVDRERWNSASRDSFMGRLDSLKQVFSDISRPSKAVAFESENPKDAVKLYPDLVNVYASLKVVDLIAKQNYETADQQKKFVDSAKAKLVDGLENNRPIAAVMIRDQKQTQEKNADREKTQNLEM